ncbi:MAG: alpha-2-macroglobulin [Hyphomonadaceae bacterium]
MAHFGNWLRIVSVSLVLAISACGGDDKPAHQEEAELYPNGEIVPRNRADQRAAERRDRQRQAAIEDAEADFTYFRYKIDVSGDAPRACFVFSAALAPEQDYSSFVEFRPAFRPALSVEGRELCVGGLGFGEERTAILKSGLQAEDGRALQTTEEVPISFEDRPAYVGFKGAGIILPRLDADGLAVETVNVDQVEITVSRVNDRALAFERITAGRTNEQGGYNYGNLTRNYVATELWTGTMPVTRAQNAPVVTVFPLADVVGELKPGAYIVNLKDGRDLPDGSGPPASSERWIVMTDLALSAYSSAEGMDVTLRSLQTGQAVSGTGVELIGYNNDVLAEAQTNAEGRVSFDGPILAGKGNSRPKLVIAHGADGDTAILDLTRAPVDLASEEVGGRNVRGDVDGFIYAERGIYRPGETVHLTGLTRDQTGRAVVDRSGAITIKRPNGLEAQRVRFDGSEAGAVALDFALPKNAARGQWRAAIDIDGIGTVGTLAFSVEDFVPQRIAVELDGDETTPIKTGEVRELIADTRFLYGAPGAGLTVRSQARIGPDPSPFDAFEGFSFGPHQETFAEQVLEFSDQTSDGEGKAIVRLDPGANGRRSGRPLRVNAIVSVLEPGGRAVTESVRIPYRPESMYLGIKSDGRYSPEGEPRAFELAAVNPDGQAIAARLEWKVIRVDFHYDWYRSGDTWRWRRSRSVATVNEGVTQTAAGATETVTIEGLDYGSHELIVSSNGRTATQGFYVGWGGQANSDGVEAPDRVSVSGPDEAAETGRDVQVSILPPYDGIAEITVATDRILSVQTRDVSKDGTRVSLPVSDEWGEGAYVMVTVYSPRDPVFQAKPRRALGVTYVPVDTTDRKFDVTINAPDVVRPRQEQTITVDVEGGPREQVFMTLAAVDEGILRLTKYQSPDAVNHFLGKKALGVSLYDDYGRLLDPNQGLPAEVRTGGDQLGGEGLSVVPTKTVALFSGIVDIGRSGKAKIPLTLPDFNGELRLMAVVWSESGLGNADRAMTVRDRVPTELILPRFLAPGDEAFATASIDNVEGEAGAYGAKIASTGPIDASSTEVSRILQQGQRADERLKIEADGVGISELRLSVDGPDGFAISRNYPIETRSAFLPVSRVSRTLMEPGQTYSPDPDMMDGFVDGSASMMVSFSSLPVDAGALYSSLDRYPYGCTEQTVSRAMPLLYAEQLVGLVTARGEQVEPRDDGARTRVQEAINTVLNRQSGDGAFGLWRESDRHATPWLGAYTADFLYRAKEEGYAVPAEALERAYSSMLNISEGNAWRVYGYDTDVWEGRWHNDTQDRLMQRSSAYALYVLAKAGKADISRLRYLHDRSLDEIPSPLARAHIAAALGHMGDRSRAKSAFASAISILGFHNNGDYYQTGRRDLAGVFALAAETGFNDIISDLIDQLGDDLPDPHRLTTQEKAFLLLATNGLVGEEDGLLIETEGLGRGFDNEESYALAADQVSAGTSFTLGGEKPVYRTVIARGVPLVAPPAASENLSISKTFHAINGSRVDIGRVRQGDQIAVVLKISPEERRLNPLIIADLLPAGMEIETILRPADGRIDGGDNGAFGWIGEIGQGKTSQAQDDRFLAAIDVRDQDVTLAYLVRAVTPGEFTVPGATAEDMYRPDVTARSSAGRMVISPSSGGTGGKP